MAYRLSRRAIVFTAVAAAVVIAFILLLPEIARRIAISRLQGALTVPVSIGDVDVNLFTGDAAIHDLVIGSRPQPIASVPRITLGFSRFALLTGGIDLSSVSLHEPALMVERTEQGEYNVAQAIAIDKGGGGAAEFALRRLEIHDGRIDLIDRTREPDYQISFTSLGLAAGPISTLAGSRLDPTNFTAGLRIAGGIVRIAGSSKPLAERLDLDVTVEADNIELARFGIYLPYGGRLNLRDTMIDARARYVLTHRDAEVTQHTIDASLEVGGFGLATTEQNRQLMQLAGVEARDIHIDFLKPRAQIGTLFLVEPYLRIERDTSGFNFAQFLPEAEGDAAGPEDGSMPWVVERVEAQDGSVEFIDRTVDPAVNTAFNNLTAAGAKMTLWPNFSAENLTAEAQSEKGSLRASGSVGNRPLDGEFTVVGNDLPFTPFRGYLNTLFTSARSAGDLLNGDLKLTFAPVNGGAMATSISGKLEGRSMALHFPGDENPFLTTRELGVGVNTIRLGVDPLVEIEEINFRDARLDFLRDQEGDINLRRLWSDGKARNPKSAAESQTQDEEETTTVIRAITVQEGVINVADRSVSPNYTTQISRVTGKITELLPARNRAEISFEGILAPTAKIQLSGWATPFTEKPYMHLEGAVRSYDLPPLNPYATEYVSHRVRQGEITTEISYTMDGNDMRAKAEVVLRDVRLGEKTGNEFEERVGIPLDLALALLQDIQGVVRLQFEMTGGRGPELDINIGRVIWNAVRSAVVGAVTAPFRLIGRIFTRGNRIEFGIEPVRFQPGSRDFEEQSLKHLSELAEVLREKPRLEVRLQGRASREEAAAIRQRSFWQKIDATGVRNYQDALVQVYRDMTGTALKPPLAQPVEQKLEQLILERLEITDSELQQLARARAETVQQELAKRGVDAERLLLSEAEVVREGDPVVGFSLVS